MDRLKKILKRMGRVVIAFSGGVDSTFLLKAAKETLGSGNVLAVTAASETYPAVELKEAKGLAKKIGVRQVVIRTGEFNDPRFRKNPPQRCYYCKKELFKEIGKVARREGFRHIADASNYDDRKDFRPGSRAAKESGV
ncbi:MAG: 7-cyano-7-deazaguanine synthase, partial [Candidatus Omnitrophica bacterium]|nr:7-cyano-7-deazaguanine synthase [Candidatus Omnitrophota bacterium]